MRQILCLLLFALVSHKFTQAEHLIANCAQNTQHLLTKEALPVKDTVVVDLFLNTTVELCPDTLEIQPPDVAYITPISQETSSSFYVDPANAACIVYNGSGDEGIDTLLVGICNQDLPLWCDTTIFVINLTSPPAPTANDDVVDVIENETTILNLIGNDDVSGNFGIFLSILPENGVATINENDEVEYIPNNNFCGQDSFKYNLCNGNCSEATVFITVICDGVEGEYDIYNSFSPNGDGINDFMAIIGIGDPTEYRLKVFNRWGIEVYDSRANNDSFAWDGTWNGKDLPDGTFYYTFETPGGTVEKGFVQIYR